MLSYEDFLASKIKLAPDAGVDVADGDLSPILKPHQRDIVRWCARGGRRAIFASFGLGKTLVQLEIMRILLARCDGPALIVCPLGVRQEFTRDAAKIGLEPQFIRRPDEMAAGKRLFLTNYESIRDGRLDPAIFAAASLDEASVLRSYGSKTFQEFMPLFEQVPYRFVATATPSPNRFKELIHYAGFLGVMDTGQALTRFFQRDSTQANNLTIYPHKEREFWAWVASWAVFIRKPSDLGYDDTGYDLPPLSVHWHEIPTDHAKAESEKDGQGVLFKNAALGVTQAAREKRASMAARVEKLVEIVTARAGEHALLWHDLEDERRAIEEAVPSAVSVYGAMDLDERERRVIAFSDGEFQYLATKPELSGSGCNFQRHCALNVFLGVGYSFNDFIQSLHRTQRYGQPKPVEAHIIYTEAEREIVRALQKKWDQHEMMADRMGEIIREFGLGAMDLAESLKRAIGVERIEVRGDRFSIANNDCVMEARLRESKSVGLIVTSIPFSNHYEYTPSYNDFGHTEDNAQFWAQMDYLTPELLRMLQPGRLACVHVKDRILFGNVTGAGAPTVSPFHAEAIFHYRKHGFDYMGLITVVTDVVRENNQTYRLGWTEMSKDGTKMGVGSPEYIVLLRKPQTDRSKGYADTPVKHDKADYTRARWQVDAHAFWRSSGDRLLKPEEMAAMGPDKLATAFTKASLQTIYDYESHVRIGEALDARGALPSSFMSLAPGSHDPDVWHDINRMVTLNTNQARRNQELHICPLQLDIVNRLIERYSNPGDLVFDPFGGVMTVPYCALLKGRRAGASELNAAYFLDGVHYCEAAARDYGRPTLFDFAALDAPTEIGAR